MSAVAIAGWVALVVTVVYTSLGLGAQVWRNHKARRVDGLSLFMMASAFLTFSSWVVYGLLQAPPDYFIVVPNTLGAVGSATIVVQIVRWRGSAGERA